MSRKLYEFDWTACKEEDIRECMETKNKDRPEDNIYGFLGLETDGKKYMIDIHYEYYGYRDHGFDLEVYEDTGAGHGRWIGCIKTIKSAKDYTRFRRRAENAVISFLSGEYHDGFFRLGSD